METEEEEEEEVEEGITGSGMRGIVEKEATPSFIDDESLMAGDIDTDNDIPLLESEDEDEEEDEEDVPSDDDDDDDDTTRSSALSDVPLHCHLMMMVMDYLVRIIHSLVPMRYY